eukprot:sb/3472036/
MAVGEKDFKTNQNSLFRSRDWLSANQGLVFPVLSPNTNLSCWCDPGTQVVHIGGLKRIPNIFLTFGKRCWPFYMRGLQRIPILTIFLNFKIFKILKFKKLSFFIFVKISFVLRLECAAIPSFALPVAYAKFYAVFEGQGSCIVIWILNIFIYLLLTPTPGANDRTQYEVNLPG